MVRMFDITPKVSIIGPTEDLLIVLRDLHKTFSVAEEYYEEYQFWEACYQARKMKDMIYNKITAIEAGEIIKQPGRDPEKEGTNEHS